MTYESSSLYFIREYRYNKGYSNYIVKRGILMKDMFSIGELASYQNISKQTLIYYDKIGLFKPAYVDPDNKYRYYTVKQVDYLDTILIMKEMGFTLNEIQEHMKNYTIDTSLITMRKQLTVIDQQITHLELSGTVSPTDADSWNM